MCVISVPHDVKSDEKSIAFKKWLESEDGRLSIKASANAQRELRKKRMELAKQTRKKMSNRILK
jgi:hypothetical protein